MKTACAVVSACAALAGSAHAQRFVSTTTATAPEESTSSYEHYVVKQDEIQPSPSDIVVPEPEVAIAPAEASGCTCGPACSCEAAPFELLPETCCGVKIGGWFQAGYHDDNAALNGLGGVGAFNQHRGRANLHQAWLFAEKQAVSECCNWDWGFRVDMVYGVDGPNTQAFGNPGASVPNQGHWDASLDHGSYGWAFPQAYAELARGDLSIKIGHFFTIIGYESVAAPQNFFYSHSFTMVNSEPFTHTGALASYQANDATTLYAGWTMGWDTGFDRFGQGSNFLGGFTRSLSDSTTLSYMTTAGDFGANGDGYSHSLVLDTSLTDRLNYVFQSDFVKSAGTGTDFGINQYLFYDVNDCWSLGTRLEWWKNGGRSWHGATFGANWSPHTNFVVRPEIRHEWVPSASQTQTIFGIDAIFTF